MTNSFKLELDRLMSRLYEAGQQLSEVTIFLVVALLAIQSISEIAARQSYLGFLQASVNEIQSDLVDQYAINPTTADTLPESRREFERLEALKKIRILESSTLDVKSLITLGTENSGETLRGIQFFLKYPSYEYLVSTVPYWPGLKIEKMRSDNLLALAIMACGAIGALIAGMRQEVKMTIRNLTLGLATGFIVYLAIRGGKSVFILQSMGEPIPFNPYGSAFAGLLAGLFTERAYKFLSGLVDQAIAKFEKTVAGK